MGFEIPILIIGYNRPEFMKSLLDIVSNWQFSKLYISIDGPKSPEDYKDVEEVQKLIMNHQISKNQNIRFIQKNLGCKDHVLDALKWFYSNEESGIVLEDDCLPDDSFYIYSKTMLNEFKGEQKILMIAGTNFKEQSKSANSPIFSVFPHVWGWASWKDRIEEYLKTVHEPITTNPVEAFKNTKGFGLYHSIYWMLIALNMKYKKIDTWDYQLSLFAFRKKLYTIVPPVNIVENIGFNHKSTNFFFKVNSNIQQKKYSINIQSLPNPTVKQDLEYDHNFVTTIIRSNYITTSLKFLITLLFPKYFVYILKRALKYLSLY
jgi:hypothetical protein